MVLSREWGNGMIVDTIFCFGFVCLESWYLAISVHLYSISPLRPYTNPAKTKQSKTKTPKDQKTKKHKIAPRRREDIEIWVLQSYLFWYTFFFCFVCLDIWTFGNAYYTSSCIFCCDTSYYVGAMLLPWHTASPWKKITIFVLRMTCDSSILTLSFRSRHVVITWRIWHMQYSAGVLSC